MLARKTGCPVTVFHIGVDREKTFTKTWDHFLMRMPFARTVISFAPSIYVPADADQEFEPVGLCSDNPVLPTRRQLDPDAADFATSVYALVGNPRRAVG